MVKNTPNSTHAEQPLLACQQSKKLCWFGLCGIVLGLFILAASAFVWVPKLFPQYRSQPQDQSQLQHDMSQMASDIGHLKTALSTLKPSSNGASNNEGVWHYVDLKLKVESGLPFLVELRECLQYAHQELPPKVMEIAQIGRPTLGYLYTSFLEAASQEAAQPDKSGTSENEGNNLWDKMIREMRSLSGRLIKVKVTPEGVKHLSPELQKHLSHIKSGNLEDVISFAQERPEFQDWVIHGKAFLEINALVHNLRTAMQPS